MIVAGIVLFNPEIERLYENVSSIVDQVDMLLLVDNGSNNISQVKSICRAIEGIEIIELGENKGIAFALNEIINWANSVQAEWVLTLDQDSICSPRLIQTYQSVVEQLTQSGQINQVGLITCRFLDRNIEENNIDEISECKEIGWCITSGSLMNTKATLNVGGFENRLFIDKVDLDICLNLRRNAYKLIQTNYYGLLHEIGHATMKKTFAGERVFFNHSAFRRYYMIRNGIYLLKKYRSFFPLGFIKTDFLAIFWVFVYENQKWGKLKKSFQGIWDGLLMKVSK